MLMAVLEFVLAAAVIVAAGTALTRYADAFADLTGLGRLLVGSIMLAGATSLPELMVDLNAVKLDPNLAIGDLMGSSLFNLAILAVADLTHRSRGYMLSRASAAHALSATMSMALTALVGMSILVGQKIELAVGGVGIGSIVVLLTYAFGVRVIYYDQRFAAVTSDVSEGVLQPAGKVTLRRAIIGYVACAALILLAAPFLAEASHKLAEMTGLGGTFFGTTMVALCTSLPELVATATAVRMGAFDLVLGNIFGSNAFNMMLIVPLDFVYPGALMGAVSHTHILTALAVILITCVVVVGQLYHAERRITFLEPDAVLVILLAAGAIALVYFLGDAEFSTG